MRRRRLPDVLLLWALALGAGQAWAHQIVFPVEPGPRDAAAVGPVWRAMSAVPDLGWLAVFVAAALILGTRRPRRALVLVLAALVVVLAFEGSRQTVEDPQHSIHARDRVVDGGTLQLVALPAESSAAADLELRPAGQVAQPRSLVRAPAPRLPARDRAPPSRTA